VHPFQWTDHHVQDATTDITMVLYGAPNTGKSTFVTALLDGFILRTHEPTPGLEMGTFSVSFGPHRMNVTLYDGAVSRISRVALGLVFVDLSNPNGIEDATRSILGIQVPPTMCVVGTKYDCGSVTENTTLRSFAGSVPGHLVEVDPRQVQVELVVKLLQVIADGDAAVKHKIGRSQALHDIRSKVRLECIPTTEEGLSEMFHRYDVDGIGSINFEEAEALYQEFNQAGFGNCRVELDRIALQSAITSDSSRVTFDQFCLLMCSLARM
jgi:hypothetical protein